VWIAQLPLDRAQPVPVRGDPAGAFEPLDQGWAHFVQRLWWYRPCETTWVD
jgi:hypothetical protein